MTLGIRHRGTASSRRSILATLVAATLALSLVGCTPNKPAANYETDIAAPSMDYVGEPIRVAVSQSQPLAVSVPGLGRIVGPSGAFTGDGEIVVRQLAAETVGESLVRAAGPGVDVQFEGTSLASPLTVFFDDPAIQASLPGDALPLVLHLPDGSPWEARALEFTPDGIPYIVTSDFSPNLLSWISIPESIMSIPGRLETWFAGAQEPRDCSGGAPEWGWVSTSSPLVNLCTITNIDSTSNVVRAELQVQSNRQYYQWVTVPPGNDYLWVADQPDLLRQAISQITGHDMSREVLLAGGGWLTAGYRQGQDSATKEFRAYTDGSSTAIDLISGVLGLAPTDKGGWAGIVVLLAQCRDDLGSSLDLLGCAVQSALENLSNPDTAFSAAMSIFGEKSYAEAYASKLKLISTGLQWLGKVFKVLGIAQAIQAIVPRLLDWGQQDSTFGHFSLNLDAAPRAVVQPAPVPIAPPTPQTPVVQSPPAELPSQPAPPEIPTQPRAWVSRAGDTITYYWENIPPGQWPLVTSFRCWRYTEQNHPGGWATDGCGQLTGYAGYPSGTGSLSFTYAGASDSFSVEPWKYGPWLNVGEVWQG